MPSVRSPQLLVIGVDGATPEIVDRLCGEGKLPHLSRLRAEGASGELRSLEPIFSPLIWTTMATGRMPEDHGITGFTLAGGEAGLLRPSSTDQRQVPALWNLAGDAGYTNAVIGWPVTWPAEKINGYLVSSYFFMPSATADLTRLIDPELEAIWPTTLGSEIAPLLKSAGDFTPRELAKRRLGALAANPMNLSTHAKDATFLAIAGELLAKKSPDVMMVYFQGIDVLGHNNWPMFDWWFSTSRGEKSPFRFKPGTLEPYLDADGPQPPLTAEELARLREQGEVTEIYYEWIDQAVGSLVAIDSGRPRLTCVLSDHGFGRIGGNRTMQTGDAAYTRPLAWHTPRGIFLLAGEGAGKGVALPVSGVEDVFPTLAVPLRIPLADNLAGKTIPGAYQAEWLAAMGTTTVPAYAWNAASQPVSESAKSQEQTMMEQLRSLGYVK